MENQIKNYEKLIANLKTRISKMTMWRNWLFAIIVALIGIVVTSAIIRDSKASMTETVSNQEFLEAALAVQYLGWTEEDYIGCTEREEENYIKLCKADPMVVWVAKQAKKKSMGATSYLENLRDGCYEELLKAKREISSIIKNPIAYDYERLKTELEISKRYYLQNVYLSNDKIIPFTKTLRENYNILLFLAYSDEVERGEYIELNEKIKKETERIGRKSDNDMLNRILIKEELQPLQDDLECFVEKTLTANGLETI